MGNIENLKKELRKAADKKKAAFFPNFFKTGKGQYGEGDVFLGVTVPVIRAIAHKHLNLNLRDLKKLLVSKIHEERYIALEVLVAQYERAISFRQQKIARFYLNNLERVNNWDLVDTSAPHILGNWLLNKPRAILYKLAVSKNLWKRRVAIVSTLEFIKNNQLNDTFKLTELLLYDSHDLIHKACGWMLREAGKRSEKELKQFLNRHYKKMPRTMLRYAIERFPKELQKRYLKGQI